MTASPDVVRTIVSAVVYKPDGAVFSDIADALPPSTTSQQIRDWISELVVAGILEKDPATHRYFAMQAASAYLAPRRDPSATESAATNVARDQGSIGPSGSTADANAPVNETPTGASDATKRKRTRRTSETAVEPAIDASADVVPALINTVVRRAISASPPASPIPGTPSGSAPTPPVAGTQEMTRVLSKLVSQWVGKPGSPTGVAKIVAAVAVILAIPAVLQVIGTSPWLTIAGALVVLALVLVIGPRTANSGAQAVAETRASDRSPGGTSTAASATVSGQIENRDSKIENPSTSSRLVRSALAAACLLGVAAIVSVVWYVRTRSRPPTSEVSAYLVSSLAPLPVRVATLNLEFSAETSSGCRVAYRGVLQTTEPLLRRLETSTYLSQHFAPEMSAIDSAGLLLRGPDGPRIRSFLVSSTLDKTPEIGAPQAAPAASPTLGNPPGTANADVSANKGVAMVSPFLERGLDGLVLVTTQTPPGTSVTCSGVLVAWRQDGRWMFTSEAAAFDRTRVAGDRKPLGSYVFAVDVADDLTRLRMLLSDAAKDASKVQVAATAAAAHIARDRQQRVDSLGQLLRPGTLFAGTYADSARGESQRVALEITDASSATRKVAALLRNDGGWADARMFSGEWTVDADGEACVLTLRTRRDDRIVGAGPLLEEARDASMVLQVRQDGRAVASDGKWRLQRVAADEVASIKADIMKAVMPALTATRSGTTYRGTVTSKGTRTIETLVLRFVGQEQDGAIVRATLRPEFGDGPERPFSGRILDNTYRGAGNPIRLQSSDAQAVAVTNTKSLLAFRSGAGVSLDLRVDGTRLVGESGWFTYEFDRLEGEWKAEVGRKKEEGERQAAGGAGAAGGAEAVGGAGPAGYGPFDKLRAGPFDKLRAGPFDGLRAGDPDLHQTQPAYPTTAGVYVLSGGMWKALLGSKGTQVKAAAKGILNFVGDLNLLSNSEARRKAALLQNAVTEITFSDSGPVPTAKAGEVVIVCVGVATPVPAEVLAQHPELRTYPAIEMAPARTLPTGARYAPIGAIVPGFTGFGADRVAATLEQPAAGITVLRCSASLPRGRYVVLCGGRGYEVGVE